MGAIFDDLTAPEKQRLWKIEAKKTSYPRECYNFNCNKKIRGAHNHLLQEKGVLDKISEGGSLYQYSVDVWGGNRLSFYKNGINKVLRGNMLCPECDHKVFRCIEGVECDFENGRTHFLLSLRSLLWEKRKQENNWLFWDYVERDPLLSQRFGRVFIEERKSLISLSFEALSAMESRFFTGCTPVNLNRKIGYKYRKIRRVSVAASCISSLRIGNNIHLYFLYVIPVDDGTIVSMVTLRDKEDFINSMNYDDLVFYLDRQYKTFESVSESDLLKSVSDILLFFSEDWVCSPSFYRLNVQPRETEISQCIFGSLGDIQKFYSVPNAPVNLFGCD